MTWEKTRGAPLIRFLEKLAGVYAKSVELHAAKQTHRALLQVKSQVHSERKRRERERGLDRTKS
jgi:hypothetical protein